MIQGNSRDEVTRFIIVYKNQTHSYIYTYAIRGKIDHYKGAYRIEDLARKRHLTNRPTSSLAYTKEGYSLTFYN